jgi:hypothetical protein
MIFVGCKRDHVFYESILGVCFSFMCALFQGAA